MPMPMELSGILDAFSEKEGYRAGNLHSGSALHPECLDHSLGWAPASAVPTSAVPNSSNKEEVKLHPLLCPSSLLPSMSIGKW